VFWWRDVDKKNSLVWGASGSCLFTLIQEEIQRYNTKLASNVETLRESALKAATPLTPATPLQSAKTDSRIDYERRQARPDQLSNSAVNVRGL
jgi:hypothetical protein